MAVELSNYIDIIVLGSSGISAFMAIVMNKWRVEQSTKDLAAEKERQADRVRQMEREVAATKEVTDLRLKLASDLGAIRSNMVRIPDMDESLRVMNERQHKLSGELQVVNMLVGQMQDNSKRVETLEDRMEDKARRMVIIETHLKDLDRSHGDLIIRVNDMDKELRGKSCLPLHRKNNDSN